MAGLVAGHSKQAVFGSKESLSNNLDPARVTPMFATDWTARRSRLAEWIHERLHGPAYGAPLYITPSLGRNVRQIILTLRPLHLYLSGRVATKTRRPHAVANQTVHCARTIHISVHDSPTGGDFMSRDMHVCYASWLYVDMRNALKIFHVITYAMYTKLLHASLRISYMACTNTKRPSTKLVGS